MEDEQSPTRETTDKSSRRRFLDFLIGLTTISWIGTIVYPVLRYLKPLPQSAAGGPIQLSAEHLATIARKKFVIVRAGRTPVIVFEDPGGELRALSAVCTHEGCIVQYQPGRSIIWCACHNGKFDLDGTVLAGPPPRPLPPFRVQRDDEGNVQVLRVEHA